MDALDIDIADDQQILALKAWRLGENIAILCNDRMAAEDKIGRRFAYARRGVDIAGDASARLVGDQLTTVARFANDFIAGGKINENFRAGQGLLAAWRDRRRWRS